jgi:signal transduction histidine kinase/ligand-binding sensor domain-containing protein
MRQVALLCIVFGALRAFAQPIPKAIEFDHLALPGVLKSTQVTDIVQDKHGIIWVSGDGLFRYDGLDFKTYKILQDSGRIDAKEIHTLFYDSVADRLLIGTHSHGVVEYNYHTDKLRALPTKGRRPPIAAMMSQTADGKIWVSSFSDGIHYVDGDTLYPSPNKSIRLQRTTCLITDEHQVWVSQMRTIYRMRDHQIIDSVYLDFPGAAVPDITRVTAMTFDRRGYLWLGTERSGVFMYDTTRRQFARYLSPEQAPFFNRITRIFEDFTGLIWIAAKSNGMAVYSPSEDRFVRLQRDPLQEQSLSGDNCSAVLQDKTGCIWITSTGDVNKYDPHKLRFRHVSQNTPGTISLTDNMVRGVYEDSQQNLWVGTDGGTIHIFNRFRNTIEKIPARLPDNPQHFLPLYFLELDPATMLVASSQGLLQIDRRTKKVSHFKPLQKLTEGALIRQVLQRGQKLFCIQSGVLIEYDLRSGAIKKHRHGILKDSTKALNITAMHLDTKNRLWIGASAGVSLFQDDGTFRYFPFEENVSRPAGSYFMVLSIQEYRDKLWVGTFNGGLWVMDIHDLDHTSVTVLTEKEGLPNNTVYASVPDDRGMLWVTTNRGISRYDTKNNNFLNFMATEGLQQEEFNRLAYTRCKNGEIAFGGIAGVTVFNPNDIIPLELDYIPQFLSLTTINSKNEQNYYSLLHEKRVRLNHTDWQLDFQYLVPNYQDPRPFQVYYKMEHFDRDWSPAEGNRIRYANLKPGDYTLMIKTVSYTGQEHQTSLPLHVASPFYQTTWFILLTLASVGLMVFTVIQSYSRKARKDKERLEQLLQERTREIVKSREELAILNQKKDLIFSILSHDLRSPLTTLKGFLSVLIDMADSLTVDEIKRHASSIRNSVTSSLDLIDNTLFWSLSQTGNISYAPTSFSLEEMIRKIMTLYQLTVEKKRVQLFLHTEEDPRVYADENMIYVTLRNIVSNAIKFTPEGKSIHIHLRKHQQLAEVTVADEGIGMSPSYLRKLLNEDQLQLKKGTSNEKGTGLGLVLCKKFIQLNNGYMEIQSVENQGTQFTVRLPLAKS